MVDLVIDRAPPVGHEKTLFDAVVVDTKREIAASKITTLLSRSEIKGLVDLIALADSGVDLDQAIVDARKKDSDAEPATLAWVLEQIEIGQEARLPGDLAPERILALRDDLVRRLRQMAFREAQRRRRGAASVVAGAIAGATTRRRPVPAGRCRRRLTSGR